MSLIANERLIFEFMQREGGWWSSAELTEALPELDKHKVRQALMVLVKKGIYLTPKPVSRQELLSKDYWPRFAAIHSATQEIP